MREVLRGRVLGGVVDDDDDDGEDDDSEEWESEGAKVVEGFHVSPSPFAPRGSSVVEHGVLLECSAAHTLKVKASLQYWVIG